MPGRNIIKSYAAESYYHVYTRGVNRAAIFQDADDYIMFLGVLKRYLSPGATTNTSRHVYKSFTDRINLSAYALMGNHIHLLIYQYDERAIADFMRSVLTSYSIYFNKKYNRVGPLFQSRYRASLIYSQQYLEHISRYIHLNPADWESSDVTSLKYYRGDTNADWIDPRPILSLFKSTGEYLAFLSDYEAHKAMLEEVKWELANDID